MENRHGPHQVAQKSTTVTFPRGSAELPPPSRWSMSGGALFAAGSPARRLPCTMPKPTTLAVAAITRAQIPASLFCPPSTWSAIGTYHSGEGRWRQGRRKIAAPVRACHPCAHEVAPRADAGGRGRARRAVRSTQDRGPDHGARAAFDLELDFLAGHRSAAPVGGAASTSDAQGAGRPFSTAARGPRGHPAPAAPGEAGARGSRRARRSRGKEPVGLGERVPV